MRVESGDTLVEVLIATAILAAAVVGGLGIMNFGFGSILNSVERTQAQAEITSQLSLIQYARDAYITAGRDGGTPAAAVWTDILRGATITNNPKSSTCTATGTPETSTAWGPFYVGDDGVSYHSGVPATATAAPEAGSGLWVEAVRPAATANYIDFYVKACWQPAAGAVNQESRSTMRLYVP